MNAIRQLPVRTDDGGLLTLAASPTSRTSRKSARFIAKTPSVASPFSSTCVDATLPACRRCADETTRAGEIARRLLDNQRQFKNLIEAKKRLAIVVPLALALIFVLIFFALGSVRQVLLVIPASARHHRRHLRDLDSRNALHHQRGRRLHRVVRCRGVKRADDDLLQPAARTRPRRGNQRPRRQP